MWPRLLQFGIATGSLAATSPRTTHAPPGRCHASVRPVGKALNFSREDCCCNLYHTKYLSLPTKQCMHTNIFTHKQTHAHTKTPSSPHSQDARMGELFDCVFTPDSNLLNCVVVEYKRTCCVCVSRCRVDVYYVVCVLWSSAAHPVGWHELLEGRFGSAATSRQWGTSWGPAEKWANRDSGGFPFVLTSDLIYSTGACTAAGTPPKTYSIACVFMLKQGCRLLSQGLK